MVRSRLGTKNRGEGFQVRTPIEMICRLMQRVSDCSFSIQGCFDRRCEDQKVFVTALQARRCCDSLNSRFSRLKTLSSGTKLQKNSKGGRRTLGKQQRVSRMGTGDLTRRAVASFRPAVAAAPRHARCTAGNSNKSTRGSVNGP